MRRYGMKYHVVGGFTFYERAEIKDMISYLKVIQNPDDSIALQRVINTPARGIGKGTHGNAGAARAWKPDLSMWGAIGEAIKRQLAAAARAGRAQELSATHRRRASAYAGLRNIRGSKRVARATRPEVETPRS